MKLVVLFLISSFSFFTLASENQQNLLSGKIELLKSINYEDSLKLANKLKSINGLHSLWVRKMGSKSYGISLMIHFDGSPKEKHQLLQQFRAILGTTIHSWDLATGVTWIKKPAE